MVDVRSLGAELETNKCQQKKIGASTRLSVLTRESRQGKENRNGKAGILRCSGRESDSSTQPNKHEERNIGRALVRADWKT
jgi:hypothetical protein